MPNFTMMMEFLLMGFSDEWEVWVLHAMSFSLMYFVTVIGNVLIITVTTIDKSLHSPMYFFLRNPAILDACYISVTVPNSCVNSLLDRSTISKAPCIAQVFLVVFFVFLELMLLTIMAQDRYVAICQPLYYPGIMNPQVCVQMTIASMLSGLVYPAFHTGNTFRLHFCQSNIVHQFLCDIPSLLMISRSDTFSNVILILASGLGIGGGCFIFIIRSYIYIFSTVLKFTSGADRAKAFSTCMPHILVLSIFLSLGFYVYLKPTATSATIQDMPLSVFYSIVPPLLNPITYSLRNDQLKRSLWKIMKGIFYSGNL